MCNLLGSVGLGCSTPYRGRQVLKRSVAVKNLDPLKETAAD